MFLSVARIESARLEHCDRNSVHAPSGLAEFPRSAGSSRSPAWERPRCAGTRSSTTSIGVELGRRGGHLEGERCLDARQAWSFKTHTLKFLHPGDSPPCLVPFSAGANVPLADTRSQKNAGAAIR